MDAHQLAAELLGGNPTDRSDAADQLATMGEAAQPATCALVEACADPALRDLCVGALEELGAPPADALPRLAALVASPDETVAYWAATLLGRSGAAAAGCRDALQLASEQHTSSVARDRAAWALRKIG